MDERGDIVMTLAEWAKWVKIAMALKADFPPIFVETVIAQETGK
jgi:hypothetical protein